MSKRDWLVRQALSGIHGPRREVIKLRLLQKPWLLKEIMRRRLLSNTSLALSQRAEGAVTRYRMSEKSSQKTVAS